MAEGARAQLFVLAGPDLARSFDMGERAVLGRSDECDVVLQDRSISRKHAVITFQEGRWFVQDLGSTNGVTKNGRRVERVELKDGEEFRLGELPLRFRVGAAEIKRDDHLEFASPNDPVPPAPAPAAPPPAPARAPVVAPADAAEPEVEIEFEPDVDAPVRAAAPKDLAGTVYRAPRVERRSGFLSGDLDQRPAWLTTVLVLLLIGLCLGLSYGAFLAVRTLRGGP